MAEPTSRTTARPGWVQTAIDGGFGPFLDAAREPFDRDELVAQSRLMT
jgi:hypothetical protein